MSRLFPRRRRDNVNFGSGKDTSDINHKSIDKAVEDYLKGGGKIRRIEYIEEEEEEEEEEEVHPDVDEFLKGGD